MEKVYWLVGAYYEYTPQSKPQRMKVTVPNSSTAKSFTIIGKKNCDLVQCLLDSLMVNGTTIVTPK